MNRIYEWLAKFFGCLSRFFERRIVRPIKSSPKIEINSIDLKKQRLRSLLSQDDLAETEQKELAELVNQFEGDVIILDSPVVHSAKEEL